VADNEGDFDGVCIIEILGRVQSVPINLEEDVVDGSELASGKYMVRIVTENAILTKEIAIVR